MDSNTQDFLNVDVKKIKETQKGMLEYIKNAHPEIIDELNETKALSDETWRQDSRCRKRVRKIKLFSCIFR